MIPFGNPTGLKINVFFKSKIFDRRLFEKRVQNGETIESKFDEVFKYCQYVEIVNNHLPSYFLNSLPVGIKYLTITNPIINKEIVDEKKSAEHLAQYLSSNKDLELFALKHVRRDNSCFLIMLKSFEQHHSLRYLDLGRTSLTNQEIGVEEAKILAEVVQNNKLLQHLNLEFLQLENQAAVNLINALKDHQSLNYLNFGGNQINDAGAKVLAEKLLSKPSLQYLNLRGNSITSSGIEFISSSLKFNKILQYLNLGNNPIASQGVEFLAKALETNTTLETLILSYARIHGEENAGAKALGKLIKGNKGITKLDLSSLFVTNSDLSCLNDKDIVYIASALKENQGSKLQSVDLDSNYFGDGGAKALAKALKEYSLRSLSISSNLIADDGAKAFGELLKQEGVALEELYLNRNIITNSGASALAEALRTNKKLRALFLSFNQIGDVGVKALAKALKSNTALEELSVGRNITESVAYVTAKQLRENHGLKNLDLSFNFSLLNGTGGVEGHCCID